MKEYKICNNCVMDTSDSKIIFDEHGVCDHCNNYYNNILPEWNYGKDKHEELEKILHKLKKEGQSKKYDCIIGLSGGLDSSYLLHLAVKEFKLRPFVFCVDTCWNTETAVHNNNVMINSLGLDSVTYKVPEKEMMDLQLAFFKAQVPYQDSPQDQAIFAALYDFSVKNGFRYVLTGANHSCECVREPSEWCHMNDNILLKDIHSKFGKIKLKEYPLVGMFKNRIYYTYLKKMQRVPLLNLVPYDKENAMQILESNYGWKRYPYKHFESIFTRFFEGYWLIEKFGYDKRRAHFSSLILTEQMTREEALEDINNKKYYDNYYKEDLEFISAKLGISSEEFLEMMDEPNKTYQDYKNGFKLYNSAIKLAKFVGIEKRNIR